MRTKNYAVFCGLCMLWSALVGCYDSDCDIQPPDWYFSSLYHDTESLIEVAYYDSDRGKCRSPKTFDCEFGVCSDLSEEKCAECKENIRDWYPFDSRRQCRRACYFAGLVP